MTFHSNALVLLFRFIAGISQVPPAEDLILPRLEIFECISAADIAHLRITYFELVLELTRRLARGFVKTYELMYLSICYSQIQH